jgi:hypothetical protein
MQDVIAGEATAADFGGAKKTAAGPRPAKGPASFIKNSPACVGQFSSLEGERRAIADHCDAIGVFDDFSFAEVNLFPPPPDKFDGTKCACKTARRREE